MLRIKTIGPRSDYEDEPLTPREQRFVMALLSAHYESLRSATDTVFTALRATGHADDSTEWKELEQTVESQHADSVKALVESFFPEVAIEFETVPDPE